MLKSPESYSDFLTRVYSHEVYNGNIIPKNVLNFTYQVTEDCTLRCSYCYQPRKYHNYMTFDIAKKCIDYIFNEAVYDDESIFAYSRNIGAIFDFIGGEPFLAVDLIDQIIEYTEQKMYDTNSPWLSRHKYSFSSNGTEYFTDKVQNLIKKYGDLLRIGITVDGNKELHDSCRLFPDGRGSYDLAIAAALEQKEKYHQDATKITLAPANLDKMVDAVVNMLSLGFKYITINTVNEDVWNYNDATKFYYKIKELSDYILNNNYEENCYIMLLDDTSFKPLTDEELDGPHTCGGNGNMVALDYQGLYYPCFRYMKNSLNGEQEPLVIGHIDYGIYKTEAEKKILADFEKITIRNESPEECNICPIARGCGSCAAYNYQVFGTSGCRTTFICPMHKARALGNLYFWKKYQAKTGKETEFENYITEEIALQIIPKDEWNYLLSL